MSGKSKLTEFQRRWILLYGKHVTAVYGSKRIGITERQFRWFTHERHKKRYQGNFMFKNATKIDFTDLSVSNEILCIARTVHLFPSFKESAKHRILLLTKKLESL